MVSLNNSGFFEVQEDDSASREVSAVEILHVIKGKFERAATLYRDTGVHIQSFYLCNVIQWAYEARRISEKTRDFLHEEIRKDLLSRESASSYSVAINREANGMQELYENIAEEYEFRIKVIDEVLLPAALHYLKKHNLLQGEVK